MPQPDATGNPTRATASEIHRVRTAGKHLLVGAAHFVVKGATYGSFSARSDGRPFPEPDRIDSDFAAMAAAGLNTVRIYQAPPPDLLAAAADHGLRLIVGVDFAGWRMEPEPGRAAHRRIMAAGRRAVDDVMEVCAGRPEVLAVSVGNEVPGDLVRVHGIARVRSVLEQLVEDIHAIDPQMLTTYTNFPTTEYLEVTGTDVDTFNVFLEDTAALTRYLRHLQVVSGTKPLIVTELGLAGDVHGDDVQADSIDRQLRVVDEVGCAGATVFSWTDEWAVADEPVEGWGFGVTTADREPKAALEAITSWTSRGVGSLRETWPRLSVVVCAYNEERTMEACLESLARCDYPDLEVIVCDDGSTDRTLEISRRFPFRILELPHGGLSTARNAGIEAATGELVAFLDADAACHPEWPWYLALSFDDPDVAASGGPNLPVPDAGFVERVVARSPGSPTEVLVADDRAEHVAGCNMAFRRDEIRAIDGFNPEYTSAGDDVDVCWKLLDRGKQIAFTPAAQVFHHRRSTVSGYLRQQRGYGRAEKMLSGAHPHRFNALGQARWSGVIYGGVGMLPKLLRPVVYHGHQGHAPFQSVSLRRSEFAAAWLSALLPLSVPVAALGLIAGLASPWFLLLPLFVVLSWIGYFAGVALSVQVDRTEPSPIRFRLLVGALHLLQPFARTWGRLKARPLECEPEESRWTGDRGAWLDDLQRRLRRRGVAVTIGNPRDHWDLQARYRGLTRCKITTGIAWNWVPHVATSCALSPAALVGGLAAFIVAVWAGLAGASWWIPVILVALPAIVLGSGLWSARRSIRGAIDETTSAAQALAAGDEAPAHASA